jgi:hypothetical protein
VGGYAVAFHGHPRATNDLAFTLDGRRIPVIGREALLRNKLAVGRPQDLADAAALDAPLAPRDGESTS